MVEIATTEPVMKEVCVSPVKWEHSLEDDSAGPQTVNGPLGLWPFRAGSKFNTTPKGLQNRLLSGRAGRGGPWARLEADAGSPAPGCPVTSRVSPQPGSPLALVEQTADAISMVQPGACAITRFASPPQAAGAVTGQRWSAMPLDTKPTPSTPLEKDRLTACTGTRNLCIPARRISAPHARHLHLDDRKSSCVARGTWTRGSGESA
jgi:hypothetical protein